MQLAKNSVNDFCTLAAVTVGLTFCTLFCGEGRTSMNTLSPVEFGFVCVPWKWMLPVLDPWKQSGNSSGPG